MNKLWLFFKIFEFSFHEENAYLDKLFISSMYWRWYKRKQKPSDMFVIKPLSITTLCNFRLISLTISNHTADIKYHFRKYYFKNWKWEANIKSKPCLLVCFHFVQIFYGNYYFRGTVLQVSCFKFRSLLCFIVSIYTVST